MPAGGGVRFKYLRHVQIDIVHSLDEPLKRRSWTGRVGGAQWIEIRRFGSARETKKQTGHNSSAKVNCAAADRFHTDIHLSPRDVTGALNGENAWKRPWLLSIADREPRIGAHRLTTLRGVPH